MTGAFKPPTEITPEGEQIVTPGVTPVTLRDRLALRMAAPLEPKRPQKPCDIGLFDLDARNQIDWIEEIRRPQPFTRTGEPSGPFRASVKTHQYGP